MSAEQVLSIPEKDFIRDFKHNGSKYAVFMMNNEVFAARVKKDSISRFLFANFKLNVVLSVLATLLVSLLIPHVNILLFSLAIFAMIQVLSAAGTFFSQAIYSEYSIEVPDNNSGVSVLKSPFVNVSQLIRQYGTRKAFLLVKSYVSKLDDDELYDVFHELDLIEDLTIRSEMLKKKLETVDVDKAMETLSKLDRVDEEIRVLSEKRVERTDAVNKIAAKLDNKRRR